jgi:3D (Asp-Asp-Asp) domain-containing protein
VPRAAALALALCLWAAPSVQAQTVAVGASAYCCVGYGGGYCGKTASGTQVGPGQMAADWRVLSRFSEWFVPNYGVARVTDTGGAIRGNRIDLFFTNCADAWAWGYRTVTLSPVSAVSVDPPWQEEVERVTYQDSGKWVEKRVFNTHRGRVETFDVLGDVLPAYAADGDPQSALADTEGGR